MVLGSNIVFKIVGEGVIVKEEAFVCDYTDIVIFVGVIKSHETREKTKIHTHTYKREIRTHTETKPNMQMLFVYILQPKTMSTSRKNRNKN